MASGSCPFHDIFVLVLQILLTNSDIWKILGHILVLTIGIKEYFIETTNYTPSLVLPAETLPLHNLSDARVG